MAGKPKKNYEKTPRWHPISALRMYAMLIDGPFNELEQQYARLQECRPKPYVLDDDTINGVLRVYGQQLEDFWVIEEQLVRWSKLDLTPEQREEVERLTRKAGRTRELLDSILALAEELKGGTIEKTMARDDYELGREYVLRQPPNRKGPTALSDRQMEMAANIDAQIRELGLAGKDDVAILLAMADQMPCFKELLDTAGPAGMDELCARFNGFRLYARILENLAEGIRSGEIVFPKDVIH